MCLCVCVIIARGGGGNSVCVSVHPLEEGMASILACRIPMDRAAGGLQSMGSQSPTQLSD